MARRPSFSSIVKDSARVGSPKSLEEYAMVAVRTPAGCRCRNHLGPQNPLASGDRTGCKRSTHQTQNPCAERRPAASRRTQGLAAGVARLLCCPEQQRMPLSYSAPQFAACDDAHSFHHSQTQSALAPAEHAPVRLDGAFHLSNGFVRRGKDRMSIRNLPIPSASSRSLQGVTRAGGVPRCVECVGLKTSAG
jgi:hypothetical protein